MSIGRNRTNSASHPIAESIAEFVRELGGETLEPLIDEHAFVAQPGFAMWWRCSRASGAEPWSRRASPLALSVPSLSRHHHWHRRSSV